MSDAEARKEEEYVFELGEPMALAPVLSKYAPEMDAKLVKVLSAIARSSELISGRLQVMAGDAAAGTQNRFGDDQLEIDVTTDRVVFDCLKQSGACSCASSEETPSEVALPGEGYSVAFDPLDGSSIIPANFAVGSIFGIWPGNGLLNRTGREQSAAVMTVYGPRLTMAVALAGGVTGPGSGAIAFELQLTPGGGWAVSKERFSVAASGKVFAPGNLRATSDDPKYMALVQHWIANRYTLRYTGGMVPDVYHILCKGKGCFTNVASASAKAKLRLLYEVAPIAFIMEAAGAASCTAPALEGPEEGPRSALDVPIDDLDRRMGVCYGSTEEVDIYKSHMFPDA